MNFSEILSIAGQPGLYKYVAQSKNGIIVEALADGKRSQISGNSRVSSLADIAIFTTGEDLPLAVVFQVIMDSAAGAEVPTAKGLSNDEIKALLKSYLPSYDEDRVHISDMKKIFSWYNILVGVGFQQFAEKKVVENEEAPVVETAEVEEAEVVAE
ncbi:MAG: DUF5606 domain-containing protein [Rikenellaceae bacterium]